MRTGIFYDYVNSYRIDAVKELLRDHDRRNMNVLNMALDCGFNSKTTFNTVFKSNTGMTPTEYKRKQMNRPDSE